MEVTTECVVKIKAARVNGCLKAKFFLFSSMFHVLNSQHILQNEWQVSTKISGSMCCLRMCFWNLFSLKPSPPLSGQFFQHQGGQFRENIFRSETWVKGGGGLHSPQMHVWESCSPSPLCSAFMVGLPFLRVSTKSINGKPAEPHT